MKFRDDCASATVSGFPPDLECDDLSERDLSSMAGNTISDPAIGIILAAAMLSTQCVSMLAGGARNDGASPALDQSL